MKKYLLFFGAVALSGCSESVLFGGNIALATLPLVMLVMTINFKKF